MNKDIVILGAKGMLGQMVKRHFSLKGRNVVCFDNRYTLETRKDFVDYFGSLRNAVVFNCAGKIKQKTEDAGDLLFVNSILPADLRNILSEEVVLINPSTDCVFDGSKGAAYNISDTSNVFDAYGWSKRLGEVVLMGRPNTLVPRVSIIGPDANAAGKGLLAWAFSQKGKEVKGFTNHLWNGITTLEWCKQVDAFLSENDTFDFQLKHLGTGEFYDKYTMLCLFNDVFDLEMNIAPYDSEQAIDRRLQPEILSKPLTTQLEELKSFIDETNFFAGGGE